MIKKKTFQYEYNLTLNYKIQKKKKKKKRNLFLYSRFQADSFKLLYYLVFLNFLYFKKQLHLCVENYQDLLIRCHIPGMLISLPEIPKGRFHQ